MEKKVLDLSLSDMLRQLSAASQSVRESQVDARDSVIEAIRAIETELSKQLSGGSLRGLKNLGHNQDPLYAARVRGKSDSHVRWPDDENAKSETLVLLPNGSLQIAICRTDEHGDMYDLELREVIDDDIRAEDLENLLRTLVEIIPRTVAYADKARTRYSGLRELSINALRLLTGAASE